MSKITKKEIKIDKIKLTIGGVDLELTAEELRELRHVIDNLIGKDKEYITIPQLPIEPYKKQTPWITIPQQGEDFFKDQILCDAKNTEI